MALARYPLVERDRELASIADLLAGAQRGEPGVLLIEGPAGIGKTVLVEHARREAAAAGLQVLSARGGELEIDYPFGIISQLFEPVIRRLSADERREMLAGAAGLAEPVVAGAAVAAGSGDDRFSAVSHGLYWLTANLAERGPLLLAVDDLHWADVSSLRFLVFLARRLAGLPVAVMMCLRPGESPVDHSLLAQLAAEPGVRTLNPAGLSQRAVSQMITASLGVGPAREFVDACLAATGGTPFLLGELIATLAVDHVAPTAAAAAGVNEVAPATVATATVLRIGRLPEGAMALARAAAVLAPNADLRRAEQLAGLTPAAAAHSADALARAQVLLAGSPLQFVHPILRAAVYDDFPAVQRARAHAYAADLLTSDGADADTVAAHLLLSAPASRSDVIERLRSAAARAQARGAPENAAAYLTRALQEGGGATLRAQLLSELATATRLTDPQRAIEHLNEAIALTDDPATRVRLTVELAQLLLYLGQWQQGAATVDTALRELGGLDRELTVLLESMASGYAAFDPRTVERFDRSRPLLRAAIKDGVVTARGPALLLAANNVLRGQELSDVDPMLHFGLDHGGLLGEERAFALIPQAFIALVFTEQLDRADQLAEELLTTVRSLGSMSGFVLAATHRALIRTRNGDLRHAEGELRAAVDGLQELGLVFGLPSVLWFATDVLLERPELEDVRQLALELRLPPDFAATVSGAMLAETCGRIRAAAGDTATATRDLSDAWTIAEALGYMNPNPWNLRCELALLLAAEHPDDAHRITRAALEDARRVGLPRAIGVSLRTLGILEGGEAGLARLQESVAVLEKSPAKLERARTLVELGTALRRTNQRAAARSPLGEGLELADRCGAIRLANRARAELHATGARPRRAARSGADALTSSELRIAEMAAAGMSNPEIGQALFITRNTVETHLRHVYQKLGIRRREEVSRALEPPRPTAP